MPSARSATRRLNATELTEARLPTLSRTLRLSSRTLRLPSRTLRLTLTPRPTLRLPLLLTLPLLLLADGSPVLLLPNLLRLLLASKI
jgi:hypothetical protein